MVARLIDLEPLTQIIEHATCREGLKESSACKAIQVDGNNGLARSLKFRSGMLSEVDYCRFSEHKIQLIELSDLENSIRLCENSLREELSQAEIEKGGELSEGEKKQIRKRVWESVTNEFKRKWSGSIAIIERLYRKNKITDTDPEYQLLIVCKNDTDILMLDELKHRLKCTMRTVEVCNTEHLSDVLIGSVA